jgi:hypothetical protein
VGGGRGKEKGKGQRRERGKKRREKKDKLLVNSLYNKISLLILWIFFRMLAI